MDQCITVYHHKNHPIWTPKFESDFIALGKTNGAATYSQDIVKFHLPEIVNIVERSEYKNVIITTVGCLTEDIVPQDTDLIIYYLHEHEKRELPRMIKIRNFYHNKIIYVAPRVNRAEFLMSRGFYTIFVPMAIDTKLLKKYVNIEKYEDKRIVFFGNQYLGKGIQYEELKKRFRSRGWIFDTMRDNRLNDGELLSRDQLLKQLAKYKFGIGVGRAVLEMNALGIKTLICAKRNNGFMTDDKDFEFMKENNFTDSEQFCFSRNIFRCIDNIDRAVIRTVDVRDILPQLRSELEKLILN